MTTALHSPQMHADNSICFRNPFAYNEHSRGSWPSRSLYSDLVRALTPPLEMSSSKPGYRQQQEHGNHYGEYQAPHHALRAVGIPPPQDFYASDYGRSNGIATQPGSRTMSPVFPARQSAIDDCQLQQPGHRKQDSQTSVIAPSFQIPKSVNDSGGSLSELAAQVSEQRHLSVLI